ncbi:hypothetical protein RM572_27470 [Streptomyces sp. DSM 42041]|uniref:Tetratricopeptide repeat protein n=1 Tax=Streptomyces hazeniae TaxID=3075538 RepID=A0ABU2P0H8_9ACTN|nr:tetratricopeptide repeat protein [Streptomyces sp. DSM 42041]MDT0382504.1 hypothetical protein [Streptomyces sp. DSM 42041]
MRFRHLVVPRRAARPLTIASVLLLMGTALFAAGALLLPASGPPAAPVSAGGTGTERSEHRTESRIAALQSRLRRLPEDYDAWAQLGIAYTEHAQRTADPRYYPKADKALTRSMSLHPRDNHLAQLGRGALAAGRHDFAAALAHARTAVRINPHHAASYGVLADAHLQLGHYEQSFDATQKMVDLLPATPSLARASYAWELRGDADLATELMRRALGAAGSPADAVFARHHLALLTLRQDPEEADRVIRSGLRAAPREPALLEARARAHLARGDTRKALRDYTAAAARVPRPAHLLAIGELHESLGHHRRAEAQYDLYRDQLRLLDEAKVAADAEAVLFEADHGDPGRAVRLGRTAVKEQPFLASQDAYAWALHRAGRDEEALAFADRALHLGTLNPLHHFHRGMIHSALGNEAAARRDLDAALDIDPRFHPLHAPAARAALSQNGPVT